MENGPKDEFEKTSNRIKKLSAQVKHKDLRQSRMVRIGLDFQVKRVDIELSLN